MKNLSLLSWNVNGIRAAMRNGFLEWFEKEAPDILCVQETRANRSQIEKESASGNGYYEFWNSAERKGYSGVAIFS